MRGFVVMPQSIGYPFGNTETRNSFVHRTNSGALDTAALKTIDRDQKPAYVFKERTNIQRAYDVAYIQQKDESGQLQDYAIVSDDNYDFQDAYFQALHEAPMFVQLSPMGPPTAVGGSASALPVRVGGKLGIIKDPFGKNGDPQYLGATEPQETSNWITSTNREYQALSRVGNSLFVGEMGGNISTLSFRVKELIQEAEDHAAQYGERRLIYSIGKDLLTDPAPANASPGEIGGMLTATTSETASPSFEVSPEMGDATDDSNQLNTTTALDADTPAPDGTPHPDSSWRAGDVNVLDIPKALAKLAEEGNTSEQARLFQQLYPTLKGKSEEYFQAFKFLLSSDEVKYRSSTTPEPRANDEWDLNRYGKIKFATTTGQAFTGGTAMAASKALLSAKAGGLDSTDANFYDQGRLVFYREITDWEVNNKLRLGKTIWDMNATVNVAFSNPSQQAGAEDRAGYKISLRLNVNDYVANGATFFGDRPLDNPGYSKMKLKGEVSVEKEKNKTIDKLDVLKVEQRLRYLGFPAMGTGDPSHADNQIQNFTVDGTFGEKEKAALKLFEKIIRYAPGSTRWAGNGTGADGLMEAVSKVDQDRADPTDAQLNANQGYKTLYWLNAYNTPHWMQYFANAGVNDANQPNFAATNAALPGWNNQQIGGNHGTPARRLTTVENFGTSWMYDLMRARQYSDAGYLAGLPRGGSWFNGVTDANHGYTPGGHKTHDLGMAMDLGINPYVGGTFQAVNDEQNFQRTVAALIVQADQPYANVQGWSDARALALANTLRQLKNGTIQNQNTGNDQASALKDFLSLYAVTQGTSGSRAGVQAQIANGTAADKTRIANALFGDAGRGLIRSIYIGDPDLNRYTQMNSILTRLGVTSSAVPPHSHHFHLTLQPPKPIAVVRTQNLVAQSASITLGSENTADIVQAAASPSIKTYKRKFATCMAVGFFPTLTRPNGEGFLNPLFSFDRYLGNLPENRDILFSLNYKDAKVRVIQQPKHATLTLDTSPNYFNMFQAVRHDREYWGRDKAVFEIEYKGELYRMDYSVHYTPDNLDEQEQRRCSPRLRTVSAVDSWQDLGQLQLQNHPASWTSDQIEAQNQLAWVVSAASGQILEIVDLPATALGQTIAQGANASITLDTTAAGHGWYVDPTPLDATDDYLPTSSPNIWQAKANSAAAGKIDLLSVLLHEYGHALGLSHSSDANDFMAAKLQPGERRLPSAAELQQMSGLLAQIKASGFGDELEEQEPSLLPSPQPSPRGRGSDSPFGLNNPHPFASSPPAIIRLSPRKRMARLVNE